MNKLKRSARIFVKENWYKHTRDYQHSSKVLIPEHSMGYSRIYNIELRVTMEVVDAAPAIKK